MRSVADILCEHKAEEIRAAASSGQLKAYLDYLIKESNFYQDGDNTWAFAKVATFLEDGWQSQRQYTELKEGYIFTLDELGQMIASLVRGTRFDKGRAAEVGCRWTREGAWPTSADRAAFLFFVCVPPPEDRRRESLDAAISDIAEMPITPVLGLGPSGWDGVTE